jgi:predicted GTPase
MTESIASGKMTRAQRSQRVQDMLAEIDRIEEANRAKLQTQALDRAMKEEMQRQLDVTRRSMIMPLGR